jgi:parallel beta-helix repeat protein
MIGRWMNEPGLSDPPSETWNRPIRPSWVDRVRPLLPWLIPLIPIVAIVAAGLPFGGWRTLPQAMQSADPVTLVPGMRLDLEPYSTVIPRWLITGTIALSIGAATWLWRGGTPGFGFFAANAAFWLTLAIELGRWFKPGQLPDFLDPLIAAVVAATAWRVLKFWPTQPVTKLPRHGPWGTRLRVLFWYLISVGGLGFATASACVVPSIGRIGYAPAQVADLITSMSNDPEGLSAAIARTFEHLGAARILKAANRLDRSDDLALPAWSGAGASRDGVLPAGTLRSAATIETLRQAIDNAAPGDVILLQPGVYRIGQPYITVSRPGTADAPITLRAPRLGSVTLESELGEAVKVDAPYWRFENLVLKGVCSDDGACDNGFHIVGRAEHTVIHNLRIEDFNAQIKINGENGRFPDNGRIDHTTLIDNHARRTSASVAPIDLVAASLWAIEDNLIVDFVKTGGNNVSFGAFAKGAGRGTVFARNVVLCEWRLHGPNSATIGLSFGGGATDLNLRRDVGRSGYEYADGIMTDNLIAFCSDDGIYLNRSANTVIRHNTLIGTSGIDVRYVESMAQVDANVVDGPIRTRDDGMFWGDGNESEPLTGMFLGRNPVRSLFEDPARLDLRWRRLPALVATDSGVDLCGAAWTALSPAGAFRDYRACGAAENR